MKLKKIHKKKRNKQILSLYFFFVWTLQSSLAKNPAKSMTELEFIKKIEKEEAQETSKR